MRRLAYITVLLCLLLAFGPRAVAQRPRGDEIKVGGSVGVGGAHAYFKPSLDGHWRETTLRLAPGLFFLSGGVTQRVWYLKDRYRRPGVPLTLSLYYHEDWFVSNSTRRNDPDNRRRDLDVVMLMAGFSKDLDLLGRVYWEGGVGVMYVVEKFNDVEGVAIPNRRYWYPMFEIRIGGILQWHKNEPQDMGGEQ